MKIEWLSGKKKTSLYDILLILSCILWILLDFLIPYMYQWAIDANTFTHKSLNIYIFKDGISGNMCMQELQFNILNAF